MNDKSNTDVFIPVDVLTTSGGGTTLVSSVDFDVSPATASDKKIENAIYAHIRALRALGQNRVNTAEIAAALGLPIQTVNSSVEGLRKRGIKVLS